MTNPSPLAIPARGPTANAGEGNGSSVHGGHHRDDGDLLRLDHLSKSFPGVKAVDDVSLSVAPGTIHALLGENGAGKSTLVKMIYGVLRPDTGSMTFTGEPYAPHRPFDARKRGIGMGVPAFLPFDALTVTENVALGLDVRASDELAQKIAQVSAPTASI